MVLEYPGARVLVVQAMQAAGSGPVRGPRASRGRGGRCTMVPWYCTYVLVRMYPSLHARRHCSGDSRGSPLRQWCEGGSESVGRCCPAFAPSLNWLPCMLPKHTWFSVHVCALFQSESCDITLYHGSTYVRTYVRTLVRTMVRTYTCANGTYVVT
jgi:hypothetical protein